MLVCCLLFFVGGLPFADCSLFFLVVVDDRFALFVCCVFVVCLLFVGCLMVVCVLCVVVCCLLY